LYAHGALPDAFLDRITTIFFNHRITVHTNVHTNANANTNTGWA
jgi:hypothetical protein